MLQLHSKDRIAVILRVLRVLREGLVVISTLLIQPLTDPCRREKRKPCVFNDLPKVLDNTALSFLDVYPKTCIIVSVNTNKEAIKMIRETAFQTTGATGVFFKEFTSGFDLTSLESFRYGERVDVWERAVNLEKTCMLSELLGTKYDLIARKAQEAGIKLDAKVTASSAGGIKEIKTNRKELRLMGSKYWVR